MVQGGPEYVDHNRVHILLVLTGNMLTSSRQYYRPHQMQRFVWQAITSEERRRGIAKTDMNLRGVPQNVDEFIDYPSNYSHTSLNDGDRLWEMHR